LFAQAEDVLDGILASQHSVYETPPMKLNEPNYLEHFRLEEKTETSHEPFTPGACSRTNSSEPPAGSQQAGQRIDQGSVSRTDIATTQLALLRTDDTKKRSQLLEKSGI